MVAPKLGAGATNAARSERRWGWAMLTWTLFDERDARWTLFEIVAPFIAPFVLMALWGWGGQLSDQVAAAAGYECAEGHCHPEDADERVAFFTAWLAIITGTLAASTIALFLATFGLWRATLKAILDADANSLRQEREFNIEAFNMGQTPFGDPHITRLCVEVYTDKLFEEPPILFSKPHGSTAWNAWD